MKQLLFCTAAFLMVLSSCTKEEQKSLATDLKQKDKEAIWSETQKMASEMHLSVDSTEVMSNINNGKLNTQTLRDVKTRFQTLGVYDPITGTYEEEVPYVMADNEGQEGLIRYLYLAVEFPQLKNRNYPYAFCIGFNYNVLNGTGAAYGTDLVYNGYIEEPVCIYKHQMATTSNFNPGSIGKLKEYYYGISRNFMVYFDATQTGVFAYKCKIKFIQVNNF